MKYIDKFFIDWGVVNNLTDVMSGFKISDEMASEISPTIFQNKETTFLAYLWAAAICHATKGGLKGKINGVLYNGSDFLIQLFIKAGSLNPLYIDSVKFSKISGSQLLDFFLAYSTESKITLNDFDRRAEILNKCASTLLGRYNGEISNLLDSCNNHVGGVTGAYALLSEIDAFKDSQMKKSSVFLMNVYFSKLWQIKDENNISPMIDYHRIRLLLRTGCIKILEPQLFQKKLIYQQVVPKFIEEDLREKAFAITRYIVDKLNKNSFVVDMLLWAFARSCCRSRPLCVYLRLENSSFYKYVSNAFTKKCEFESFCQSRHNKTLRDLWEPAIITENY